MGLGGSARSDWLAFLRVPPMVSGHPVRLNTLKIPIVNKYREGKVKRTLNKGVK